MKQRERGFTIIEVSLFLAVSGLALAMMMFGVSAMIWRQRFSDTMNSTNTYIQSQVEEVQSSINANQGNSAINVGDLCDTTGGAGTSECLLLGKLLLFSPDLNLDNASQVIMSYYIIGRPPEEVSTATLTDDVALRSYTLFAVESGASRFAIPWSNGIAQAWYDTAPDNSYRLDNLSAIAVLHSPVSSAILTYQLPDDNFTAPTEDEPTPVILPADQPPNLSSVLLLGNQDIGYNGGVICLSGGATSANIKAQMPVSFAEDGGSTSEELLGVPSVITSDSTGKLASLYNIFNGDCGL